MKPDMTELAKNYEPKSIEGQIYDLWESNKAFAGRTDETANAFCIVIPPPNVTAALHLGHALNNTLQDVLIRYKRMCGFNALWMPGTDHAGIATQTVVEKRLLAEEGKRRTDFQRDRFVQRVQQWKDEYEKTILNQLRKMGCSCDWDRTRFTMDEVCARAVRAVFFKLFADGLIYRGKRLVNWDPATQTVLADDEVEHETVQGYFWYLQYPLVEPVRANGREIRHVTVATTRPETMLGDTAVAMHPDDPRREALTGAKVRLPIVGREIPIIADDYVVLPDPDSEDEKARFSTGFLKVTPAHDPNDWLIGQRHELPIVNVMAPDGSISDKYGWEDATEPEARQLLGMDRFEAREAIVEWFRQEKLLEKVVDYAHEVGHSYRSHVPIEPYLSDQWYVAVKKPIDSRPEQGNVEGTDVPAASLASIALAPLLEGELRFIPERYSNNYRNWLENLRDWPISRQLWWGHRIPIWSKPGRQDFQADPDKLLLRTEETEEGPVTYACIADGLEKLEAELEADGWQRDPDVLDTWFSSALWPFSTLGWPEENPALETWYPGDVLCTAREIITLWVSRMVMMGQYCLGDIPFSDVFIHAMIQDGEGRKMSKSLGNGIDPLVVIDSHGADAMRYTLCSMTTQTQDVRMPVTQIELPDGRKVNSSPKFDIGRNFCNKLWNASRFAMMNLDAVPTWDEIHPQARLADTWILSRLNATIRDVTRALDGYRYNELAETIYHFVWDELCDWYLEIAKARINAGQSAPKAIIAWCLDIVLRMLHPIAPYITEAIWQRLGDVAPVRGPGNTPAEKLLIRAAWPQADARTLQPEAEEDFQLLAEMIRQIRNARLSHNVPPRDKVALLLEASGREAQLLQDNLDMLQSLANLGEVEIREKVEQIPSGAASVTAGALRGHVLGIIDVQAEKERLTKQAQTLESGIGGIEKKLANENFVNKAPAQVVQRERDRLEDLRSQLASVTESLAALG